MKKIKFLNLVLKIIIGLALLGISGNILHYCLAKSGHIADVYTFSPIATIALSVLFIVGLWQVQQSFAWFVKDSFFNVKSAACLKRSGWILLAFSLLAAYNSFSINASVSSENTITNFIMYAMICVVAIGLIALSDIISDGEAIERENQLTI